jgi:hypothetical protein
MIFQSTGLTAALRTRMRISPGPYLRHGHVSRRCQSVRATTTHTPCIHRSLVFVVWLTMVPFYLGASSDLGRSANTDLIPPPRP